VTELQRLRADHASAVLAFELENRAYFAASISDRGDAFFERFDDEHTALLAEQEAGAAAFHVLVTADGRVIGRFNTVSPRGAANTVLTEETTPLEPGTVDHKMYVRGIGVVLEQTERGPNACERVALKLLPGGTGPTLEAAFEAQIGEVEDAWRDYLRAIARPNPA